MADKITSLNYWNVAKKFAKMEIDESKRWYALERGMPALYEWAKYFIGHLNWLPWGMKQLSTRRISVFMVPCEEPWMFDSSYIPPQSAAPYWPPVEHYADPTTESRERVRRMVNEVHAHEQIAGPRITVFTDAPQYPDVYERHKETGGEYSHGVEGGIECPISWADKRYQKPVGAKWGRVG